MAGRLQGKVAVITGGCSGIGLATVELFLAEGARVVVADVQDEKGADLEKRLGGGVAYSHCDVTREEDIVKAVDLAVSRFGGLDIIFNNAGTGGDPSPLAELTVEGWDFTQNLLLRGPMLGMKHAIGPMSKRGGGSIINTASIAGLEAGWGLPYGVAKAGVIHLSKLGAMELAPHNIRVNAICPGVIVTPIFGVASGLEREAADRITNSLHEAASKMQPLRRAGTPADVAKLALFLASDDAAFVTGAHYVIDGGITTGERFGWDENTPMPMAAAIAESAGLS